MNDYIDDMHNSGFLSNFPSPVRAVLICLIPFAAIDFFNYYSFGFSVVLTCLFMLAIYMGCGALTVKFSRDKGQGGQAMAEGAMAGALLWLLSTFINVILGLVLGTLSLGTTLLLGLPYLCCLAPFFLVMGAVMGGLGGLLFERFGGAGSVNDGSSYG